MAHGAQLRASGFKCCHSRPAPQLLSPAHCRPRYTGARWCPDSARILAAAAAAGKDLHPHGVVEPAAQHLPAAASAQDAPEAASPAASIGPSISSVLLRGLAACAKALAVAACVSAVHGLLGAGSAHAAAVAAAGDAASGGNPLSSEWWAGMQLPQAVCAVAWAWACAFELDMLERPCHGPCVVRWL